MMNEKNKKSETSKRVVTLDNESEVIDLVGTSIINLWGVVNDLTRLRPSQRKRYRVTIFGSARIPDDHWVYAAVRDLAEELTHLGCDIVTGGGPGLMAAANEGVLRADPNATDRSLGIRVELPFEQGLNPFVTDAYEHTTFFTRLHQFVLMSDAFVVVPGGIGSVLEAMMIWQLLQVKHLEGVPLILVGKMYAELVAWSREYMLLPEFPLANPEDLELPYCVNNKEEVLTILRTYHASWLESRNK